MPLLVHLPHSHDISVDSFLSARWAMRCSVQMWSQMTSADPRTPQIVLSSLIQRQHSMLGSPVYCHRRSATRRSLSARRWCISAGANGIGGGVAATRRGVTCIPTCVRLRGRAFVTICDGMLCKGRSLEIEHGLWHTCTHSSSHSFRFQFMRGASTALDTTSAGPDDNDEGEESPLSSFPAASTASTI